MPLTEELNIFTHHHRDHGELEGECVPETPDGYRVKVVCRCGATLVRWIAEDDPAMEIVRRWEGAA